MPIYCPIFTVFQSPHNAVCLKLLPFDVIFLEILRQNLISVVGNFQTRFFVRKYFFDNIFLVNSLENFARFARQNRNGKQGIAHRKLLVEVGQ